MAGGTKVTKAVLEARVAEMTARMAEIQVQLTNTEAQRAAAEERAAAQNDELQAAQEAIAAAEAAATAAAQQAAAANAAAAHQAPAAPNHGPVNIVPKPRGSGGSDYNVRHAMGLGNNKAKYSSILRTVRDLVHTAKLDWKKTYAQQDPLILGKLFRAAMEEEPYLARFEASWATADILKQFMRNRRKYHVRRGYMPRRICAGIRGGEGPDMNPGANAIAGPNDMEVDRDGEPL